MPRLRPLALGLALAWAVLPAFAHARDATKIAAWNQALHDERFRHMRLLDADQRRALAHDYGLENLLPHHPVGNSIPVTNCANSGAGSLRDVIAAAPSGALIDASALTCGSITLGSGEITITQTDLSIVGPGRGRLRIAPKYGRVFAHSGTGTLTISGVTIAGGSVSGGDKAKGGCIYSGYGSIGLGNPFTVDDASTGVDVTGCRATADDGVSGLGGAVYANGAVALTNSTITNSEAFAENGFSAGGGVYSTSLSAKYSEIRGNTSSAPNGRGGGAYVYAFADVVIDSSTIAGNFAYAQGGGFAGFSYVEQQFDFRNSTISGNSAHAAGGILIFQIDESSVSYTNVYNSTITANINLGYDPGAGVHAVTNLIDLESSILFGNLKGSSVPADLDTTSATAVFGSGNIIGAHDGEVPEDTRTANPLLGPLTDNGGRSHTHALRAGSPAINGGNNYSDFVNDQRGPGFARVIGPGPDIGAFEFDPDVIFRSGFD